MIKKGYWRLYKLFLMFSWNNNLVSLTWLWRWGERLILDHCPFTFASFSAPWSNNFSLSRTRNLFSGLIKPVFAHKITSQEVIANSLVIIISVLGVFVIIPNNIKVGGLTIKVEERNNLASNRDKFGEFSFMEQKITIDESLPQDKKEETLLHEIVEAINGYYSLNLDHEVITTLGFGLYQVLKDNKLHF